MALSLNDVNKKKVSKKAIAKKEKASTNKKRAKAETPIKRKKQPSKNVVKPWETPRVESVKGTETKSHKKIKPKQVTPKIAMDDESTKWEFSITPIVKTLQGATKKLSKSNAFRQWTEEIQVTPKLKIPLPSFLINEEK